MEQELEYLQKELERITLIITSLGKHGANYPKALLKKVKHNKLMLQNIILKITNIPKEPKANNNTHLIVVGCDDTKVNKTKVIKALGGLYNSGKRSVGVKVSNIKGIIEVWPQMGNLTEIAELLLTQGIKTKQVKFDGNMDYLSQD